MKQFFSIRVLFMLTAMLFVGSKTYAKEPYAVLSDEGQTVTFYYDSNKSSREGIKINNINDYAPYLYATTAVFDISFADYRPTSTAYWFYCCSHLTTINGIENLNTEKVTDMNSMFYGCSSLTSLDLSSFNTANVTVMYGMFLFCSSLTSLDVSNFDTKNVTSMGEMFDGCKSLTSLDVSSFDTSNVEGMTGMFAGCSSLTSLDVSNFNTEKVYYMNGMFSGCSALTSLDVSNFNTEKVTNMSSMFEGCSALTSLDVSNFNTEKVTNMSSMFEGCSALTSLDLKNFNTANVGSDSWEQGSINKMFSGCSALTSLDLSNFNTKNITNMSGTFSSCYVLKTIIADEEKWSTENVTKSNNMFYSCSKLVGGNGTVYNYSHKDHEYARVDKPGQPGYFTQVGTTGIDQPKAQPVAEGSAWYTLDGRRMAGQPAVGGVYVKDGRKVMVK